MKSSIFTGIIENCPIWIQLFEIRYSFLNYLFLAVLGLHCKPAACRLVQLQ